MVLRLHLIAHAPTAANELPAFPADEPALDPDGIGFTIKPDRKARLLVAPELRARETAQALGLDATIEPALAERRFGAWAGLTIRDVHQDQMSAWVSDPDFRPPGGENLADQAERVWAWMRAEIKKRGRVVAVTHPSVLRLAVIHALNAPLDAYINIDAGPLCSVYLSHVRDRWTLQAMFPDDAAEA